MLFCDQCGGANDNKASTCQFCHKPLSLSQYDSADAEDPLSSRPTRRQVMKQAFLPETTSTALKPGILLHKRYLLKTALGEGGYGLIFKAEDTQQRGKLTTIKVIDFAGHSASDTIDATATFYNEAKALRSLEHPGIPHLREHFREGQRWFLALDYVEGRTLEDYFAHLSPEEYQAKSVTRALLEVVQRLCSILSYLHNQTPPIVYRDLKPANIIVGPRQKVSLIDFGIARSYRKGQAKDTIPFGSPGYAAPEQYGRAQTTPRSDIYSLGALLHQMLTGQDPATHPFHFPPIPVGSAPLALRDIVARMLSLDPEMRPPDAQKVNDVIGLALGAYPIAKAAIYRSYSSFVDQQQVDRRNALGLGILSVAVISGLGAIFISAVNDLGKYKGSTALTPTVDVVTPIVSNELQQEGTYGFDAPIIAIANRTHYQENIVATEDHAVHIVSFEEELEVYKGHVGPVKYLATLPASPFVASCQERDRQVHIWTKADGHLLERIKVPSPVTSLAVGDNLVLVACEDRSIYTYDCSHLFAGARASGSYLRLYCHASALVRDLYWYTETSLLVSVDERGDMRVWRDGRSVFQFSHKGRINELSGRNNYVASAGDDGIVRISDVLSNKIIARYIGHRGSGILHVSWLSDTVLASLDSQGRVHIWVIDPSSSITEYDTPVLTTMAVSRYRLNSWMVGDKTYLTLAGNERTIVKYQVILV
ncbi:serine/threonine-protein kinase [Ktedonospora formicarum]|uniref:Protein kinase domain-containing protein n=1 Tax=Ktedonospora formicarum TaxID=2778364 RepID=A0A8J3I0P9_9CHLR|nr:serine/threonine-protein kinase [Ktedonospora formicarum]GHO44655.1 hypothetical protein KSX_28180 [Ktedonospora formicarum]